MSDVKVWSLLDSLTKASYSGFKSQIFENRQVKIRHEWGNIEGDGEVDSTENSNWVDENVELGIMGEQFIKNILVELYGERAVRKEPDYAGYDFIVNIENEIKRIEVKTTTRLNNPFHISINELEKARKYETEYYIYMVIMEKDKNPIVYIINNPVKTLNINMEYIIKVLNTGLCQVSADKFVVKLNKETIKGLKRFVW